MNPNQVVTKYYSFIVQKAKLINPDIDESNDLAHDVCEKILKLDEKTVNKLLDNPQGYIYRMIVNHDLNNKKSSNIVAKFKAEVLYICESTDSLDYSLLNDEEANTSTINNIAKLKKLNQFDKHILSIAMIYPEIREFSRKTGISRAYVAKYLKNLKDKLI